MSVFFTSDPHFWHINVIKYDNRPFTTVEEMNETLIKNWNSVVKPGDVIHMVGDFGFMNMTEGTAITSRLNGFKILYLGNHDQHSNAKYLRMGFSMVLGEMVFRTNNKIFRISHYPYKPSKLRQWWIKLKTGKNYTKINKHSPIRNQEDWLLHGHTHSDSKLIDFKRREIHIGCYMWNYKPVSMEQILSLIDKEENRIKSNSSWLVKTYRQLVRS